MYKNLHLLSENANVTPALEPVLTRPLYMCVWLQSPGTSLSGCFGHYSTRTFLDLGDSTHTYPKKTAFSTQKLEKKIESTHSFKFLMRTLLAITIIMQPLVFTFVFFCGCRAE